METEMNKRTRVCFTAVASCVTMVCAAFAQEAAVDNADLVDADEEGGGSLLNAVVKIEANMSRPDVVYPWKSSTDFATGSGAVIADGLILTCAHCVTDATYIRVRKHSEDSIYHAAIAFIDHDADLALVKVDDPEFMADVTPMEIGETPKIQDEVLAVGYPIGGDDISFTRGIVSRIEDIKYSHAGSYLLAVQVDAAINPGNSGGPVLDMQTGKIAGVAFQGTDKGESLGYIVPPEIIRHFLKDIEDGKVDGFADIVYMVWMDNMESPAKCRAFGMRKGQTGYQVEHVRAMLGDGTLNADDIILEIDGLKVANNGRIRIAGNEPRSIYYPFYFRQIGESVPVKVLRGGQTLETSIPAKKLDARIRPFLFGKKPDYYVFGGFVFTTVTYDYLSLVKPDIHDDIISVNKKREPGEEAVVISAVLPDVSVEGYLGASECLIRSVNGEKVRNLAHLVEMLEGCQEEFVKFGVDCGNEWDVTVIVDAKEMREATGRVMERYSIPADRSEDLIR